MAIPALLLAAIAGASGGSSATFSISATDVGDLDFGGAYAAITFNRDGTISYDGVPTGSDSADWTSAKTATVGDGFEVRITVNSGDSPNDGLSEDTWYALSSDRVFGLIAGASTTLTGNWTAQIRRASSGTVVASGTFDIEATGI